MNCIRVFSRPAGMLSCVVGNLFTELEPPCGEPDPDTEALTLCGKTHSGRDAMLMIFEDKCVFTGPPEDLEKALNAPCPEKDGCVYG